MVYLKFLPRGYFDVRPPQGPPVVAGLPRRVLVQDLGLLSDVEWFFLKHMGYMGKGGSSRSRTWHMSRLFFLRHRLRNCGDLSPLTVVPAPPTYLPRVAAVGGDVHPDDPVAAPGPRVALHLDRLAALEGAPARRAADGARHRHRLDGRRPDRRGGEFSALLRPVRVCFYRVIHGK